MKTRNEAPLQNRESYLAALEKRMNELDSQVDALETRLAQADAASHETVRHHVNALKSHRDTYNQRAQSLETTQRAEWGALHRDMEDTWQKINDSMEKAKAAFSKSSPAA